MVPLYRFGACSTSVSDGFIVPLYALIITVAIAVAVLVIDVSHGQVSATNIQRSADAAALAAARRLNGRLDGWWDAKKAAVTAVRQNPIHGVSSQTLAGLILTSGPRSHWDMAQVVSGGLSTPPQSSQGTVGQSGPVRVTVERGLFWKDPRHSRGFRFISLEADADGFKGALPYYLVANAVRVRVSLSELDTSFAGVFGRTSINDIEREAIALMDSVLERPVAPIGIPLCQLMFDTNPETRTGDHFTSFFEPAKQCERAVYVAEANAKGDLATSIDLSSPSSQVPNVVTRSQRVDGIIRAESYDRPPYFTFSSSHPNICFGRRGYDGEARNCKALPLYGTLGVPAGRPGDVASAPEVVQSISLGATASIGGYFKPLMDLRGMTEASVRAQIAEAINRSNRTFRSVFYAANGQPERNFPFLRTNRVTGDPQNRPPVSGSKPEWYDRNISMPAPLGWWGNINDIKFLMADMSDSPGAVPRTETQLNYSNPMCHDDRILHNDPDNARVLEAYAMVIAPGSEKLADGDLVRYCDFERVFARNSQTGLYYSERQSALAPIADSEPIIVGFVKVNIFDLNFELLSTRPNGVIDPRNPSVSQTANTPVYTNGNGALWDRNSFGLNFFGNTLWEDVANNARSFQDEYERALSCDAPPCSTPEPDLEKLSLQIPSGWKECFDFRDFDSLFERMTNFWQSSDAGRLNAVQDFAAWFDETIFAKPDMHCLPRLKDGHYDKTDYRSYEELRNLEPGVGCGALRARLDCGTRHSVIPTGKDWDEQNPTLVANEQE